jgi:pre-mRNA-processing factor 40
MNGFPPPGGPPTAWKEVKDPSGKPYYYNSVTNTTQWEKPLELMTENERALVGTPYKAYETKDGRPYWHNTTTNETTWEMPKEVTANLEKIRAQNPLPPTPTAPP